MQGRESTWSESGRVEEEPGELEEEGKAEQEVKRAEEKGVVTDCNSGGFGGSKEGGMGAEAAVLNSLLVPYIFRIVLLRPQNICLRTLHNMRALESFGNHLLTPVVRLRDDPNG